MSSRSTHVVRWMPYLKDAKAARDYARYLSHREERVPEGDTRPLYGFGGRYREISRAVADPKERERALKEQLARDADGLVRPVYHRPVFTVNEAAARRLAAMPKDQAEKVLRTAFAAAMRSTAKGRRLQGVFAIHWHGGHGRAAHPHVQTLMSPLTTDAAPAFVTKREILATREAWAREIDRSLRIGRSPAPQVPLDADPPDLDSRHPPDRGRRELRPEDVHVLRRIVAEAKADRPTATEFLARLQAQGVKPTIYRAEDASSPGGLVSIGYHFQDGYVRGRTLGPGHSWQRLAREGLGLDLSRDRAAVEAVVFDLEGDAPPKRLPTEDDREAVRRVVDTALESRPTLTEFVRAVESQGVEVRLYRDPQGSVFSVGYGLGDVSVSGRELGPGHSWRRLLKRGVDVDPESDAGALRIVASTLSVDDLPKDAVRPAPEDLDRIRRAVERALEGEPTLTGFVREVEAQGVEVRLHQDPEGNVFSIGYGLGRLSVSGRELGPGHSWQRLLARGLHVDANKDAETLCVAGVRMEDSGPATERPLPGPEDLDRIRAAVGEAAEGRPTLTEFVRNVEARGVEVRLYRDPQGEVFAIGYGLGRVSASGRELGPGHSWQRLLAQGLRVDPDRDGETLRVTGTTIDPAALPTVPRLATPEDLGRASAVVHGALARSRTVTEFVEHVERAGVEVRLYRDSAHRVYSAGYSLGAVPIRARDVGRLATWRGLQLAGASYQARRDRPAVDLRATTLDPPARGMRLGHLLRAYRAARTPRRIQQWLHDPTRQVVRAGLRVAARVLVRRVLEGRARAELQVVLARAARQQGPSARESDARSPAAGAPPRGRDVPSGQQPVPPRLTAPREVLEQAASGRVPPSGHAGDRTQARGPLRPEPQAPRPPRRQDPDVPARRRLPGVLREAESLAGRSVGDALAPRASSRPLDSHPSTRSPGDSTGSAREVPGEVGRFPGRPAPTPAVRGDAAAPDHAVRSGPVGAGPDRGPAASGPAEPLPRSARPAAPRPSGQPLTPRPAGGPDPSFPTTAPIPGRRADVVGHATRPFSVTPPPIPGAARMLLRQVLRQLRRIARDR